MIYNTKSNENMEKGHEKRNNLSWEPISPY